MQIRQETPADYEAVYKLVQASFATASHSDGELLCVFAANRLMPLSGFLKYV